MQARAKFKEVYDQIANTIIKIDGQKPFILSAQYRTPTELHNANMISFELLPLVNDMRNLKIDLNLDKEANIWKVKLSVYDGERRISSATAVVQ